MNALSRQLLVAPLGITICLLLSSTVFSGADPSTYVAASPDLVPESDGTWLPIVPPTARNHHSCVFDQAGNRFIIFGGWNGVSSQGDVWALSLDAGGSKWRALRPTGPLPPARSEHAAAYDPIRNRMLVFGGVSGSGRKNDVWALVLSDPPYWKQMLPLGVAPSPRQGSTMIYDPLRDRMLVFAGKTPSAQNDVYSLTLDGTPTWSMLDPPGTRPTVRGGHSAIYDAAVNRMIIFGGAESSTGTNDTWALPLASDDQSWVRINPAGVLPPGRFWHTAFYDATTNAMVVFGGRIPGGDTNDLWKLALSEPPTWSPFATSQSPQPRSRHAGGYDAAGLRFVVFAGHDAFPAYSLRGDVWLLSTNGLTPAWTELNPSNPPSTRVYPSALYVPPRDAIMIFGGWDGAYLSDAWLFSLADGVTWEKLIPNGTAPVGRRDCVAAYDTARDRVIIFGGWDGGNLNDTWALDLSDVPTWTQLATTGPRPSARWGSAGIYDPTGDRLLVFGGAEGNDIYRGDLWALPLEPGGTWTQLAPPSPTPGGRRQHTAVYDSFQERMIVYGGDNDCCPYRLSDIWALTLAGAPAWTQLTSAPLVNSRQGHVAVYDSFRRRMVVFGGYRGGNTFDNSTWSYDLVGSSGWMQLFPDVALQLDPRHDHAGVYDPVRDQMLIFGGLVQGPSIDGTSRNDLWALWWGRGPTGNHLFASDGATIDRATHLQADTAPGLMTSLRIVGPNPITPRQDLAFELDVPSVGAVAQVALFDASGRRVLTVLDQQVEPGEHSLALSRSKLEQLAAGVYFLRLELAGDRRTVRFVLLK